MQIPIYLDNNATTPVDPRVLESMIPYFMENFGNAASKNHSYGWIAEEAVELARERVGKLIGAETKEIVFTSGATEGVNLAIKGALEAYYQKGNHIISCVTEHNAVLDTCRHLEKSGASITYLPVNKDGIIDLSELESAIQPTTVLIAIMYANNETGTIQPIAEISSIARRRGVLFFTDGTQAAGKIPVDVNKDGIDILTFSAHKIYGPKGVGAIYVRRKSPRVKLIAQVDGGGHERGIRSGTLNVPGIVGFGKACELSMQEMEEEGKRLSMLRDKLENGILKLEESYVNGSVKNRLPHVSNISFKYVEGEALLMAINKTVAASSGSACTSASMEPSHVLKALGVGDDLAHSSIRFGLGRFTLEEQVDFAIGQVTMAVNQLRELSPLWEMYKEGAEMNMEQWSHGR